MLCIAYMLCLAQVARGGLCMMSRHAISFTFVLTLRSCVWSQQPSPLDLTPKPQKWALHSIVAAVCCQSAAVSVTFQVVIRLAAWTTSREAVSKAEHILCFGCSTAKAEAIQVRSCSLHPSWLRLHLKKKKSPCSFLGQPELQNTNKLLHIMNSCKEPWKGSGQLQIHSRW